MSGSQASEQLNQSAQQQHHEQQNQQPLKRQLPSSMKPPFMASGSESDPHRATSGRMGYRRLKWTAEEEEALVAAVAKHGCGKWKNILNDPDFAPFLTHRSNIDLKDKWRNLNVITSSQGFGDKSRTPKVKAPVSSLPKSPKSAPAATHAHNVTTDTAASNPSNGTLDGKIAPRWNMHEGQSGTRGAAAETATDAVEDRDAKEVIFVDAVDAEHEGVEDSELREDVDPLTCQTTTVAAAMRRAVTSKKRCRSDDGLSELVEETGAKEVIFVDAVNAEQEGIKDSELREDAGTLTCQTTTVAAAATRRAVTSKKTYWSDDGLSLLVEEISKFGTAFREINGICAFFKKEADESGRRMTIFTELMEIEGLSKDKMLSAGEYISKDAHKQRHEIPPNFTRLFSSRLRRLVSQGKLELVIMIVAYSNANLKIAGKTEKGLIT